MIKADIANLAYSLSNLREIEKMSADRQQIKGSLVLDQELRALAKDLFGQMRVHFGAYGMPVTLDRIARAELVLRVDQLMYSKLGSECDEVHRTAQSELSRIYFGFIPEAKQGEMLSAQVLWKATFDKFPSAKKDALMASRCFALECNDACVYHSMMVLERGMLALAKNLKVKKAGARAWETIIDDIETEIEKRQGKLRARKPADFLTFLSEAAKEFRYFKDAWRNHTAHGRAQYDENDARKVLIHVRDFMEHISSRLKDTKK